MTFHRVPGNPAGSVSFYDGSTLLGTELLNGSDVATLQLNADKLMLGANDITAVYAGAGDYLTSTSLADVVTVAGPAAGAVPEPATWTMLILGFAMIGFSTRRRTEGMAAAA